VQLALVCEVLWGVGTWGVSEGGPPAPLSRAYSPAVVSTRRGVMMRSIVGSSARFMNSAVRAIAPLSSKSFVKKRAVSMFTPMAPKTTAKLSSCVSIASLPGCCTRPAWRTIWAPISLCGRPAAEKSGIFCPRAIEFITSMEEMPV
jgi:hypothetical protein